jgi:ubiquinone/menaquinone biosynthesis C-methylase UbiE
MNPVENVSSTPSAIAARDGFHWGDEVTKIYFEPAERDMARHWQTWIGPVLGRSQIDYTHVLDLAAGHGRNSVRLAQSAKKITLVDINQENIRFCRQRFAGDSRFEFVNNDGATLPQIIDNSITFFYTFDSMVHFDLEVVQSYVKEAFRVLIPGGKAFFHYSNFDRCPGADFRMNSHWRNFMSRPLFEHLALRAGFVIVQSFTLPWGGIPDLDAISLLEKPAG